MSDDQPDSPLERPSADAMFSFDDAFTDDAEDPHIQFSTLAVREELARNFHIRDHDAEEELGYVDATRAEPDVVTDSAVSFSELQNMSPLRLAPSQSPRLSRNGIDILNTQMERISLDRSEVEPQDEGSRRSTASDQPAVMSSDVELSPSEADSTSQPPPRTPSSSQEDHMGKEASSTSLPSQPQIQTHQATQSLSPSPAGSSAHRVTKSTGPSTFEKFMSKTRPQFLPPKPRDEDRKHLADWERMMKLSRAAGKRLDCSIYSGLFD